MSGKTNCSMLAVQSAVQNLDLHEKFFIPAKKQLIYITFFGGVEGKISIKAEF